MVAEEKGGHILIMKSLGLVTLHGLANACRIHSHHSRHGQDGGSSSDLVVSESSGAGTLRHQGQLEGLVHRSTAHIPLPAIIGLSPRESSTSPSNPHHNLASRTRDGKSLPSGIHASRHIVDMAIAQVANVSAAMLLRWPDWQYTTMCSSN